MLIFNEGLPRAGKSYDAVANHIIPALKSGRHVYARLNGLKPYAIAQVSGIPEDEVRQLLHHVEAGDVLEVFRIRVEDDKAKTKHLNPAIERDSLFVVDECHEFWASSRADLPPEVEYFFAYHGQFGMDGVLISQWYKRLHDAVRGRVERKHLFRKLNFMQKFRRRKGKGDDPAKRYVCRQQISMEPDKFAVLCSQEHSFRPEIFPCYQSYQGGALNVEAYDPGFEGIFTRKQKIIYGVLLAFVSFAIISGYTKYRAVTSRAEQQTVVMSPERKAQAQALIERANRRAAIARGEQPAEPTPHTVKASFVSPTGAPLASSVATDTQPTHSPLAQYFFNLAKVARPRFAGMVQPESGETYGIIEWRVGNFQVLERMDTRALNELGFTVEMREGYALLSVDGETILATSYPLDSPYSAPQGDQQASPISAPIETASPAESTGPVGIGEAGTYARYGQFRNESHGPDKYEIKTGGGSP